MPPVAGAEFLQGLLVHENEEPPDPACKRFEAAEISSERIVASIISPDGITGNRHEAQSEGEES
jgi:hypothetical protein